jgi:hypothetical protein
MSMTDLNPEDEGLLISLGIIVLGNIIKPKNRDIGNFVQGFGLGTGIGTIAHIFDSKSPDPLLPHHDKVGLVAIPVTFILDKTNVIKNKDIANNLYGIGLGILSQHLYTEGCSWCGNYYCHNGEKLC